MPFRVLKVRCMGSEVVILALSPLGNTKSKIIGG